MKTNIAMIESFDTLALDNRELIEITGGVEPAVGSYAAGYRIGKWFNEMYQIWSYGLTHLSER